MGGKEARWVSGVDNPFENREGAQGLDNDLGVFHFSVWKRAGAPGGNTIAAAGPQRGREEIGSQAPGEGTLPDPGRGGGGVGGVTLLERDRS